MSNQGYSGQTIKIRRTGIIPASALMKSTPVQAWLWAGLLLVLGFIGAIAAFHGGFHKIVIMRVNEAAPLGYEIQWIGLQARAVLYGCILQGICTAMEFLNRHRRKHPAYFIPFIADAGSNLVSYAPLMVPMIASVLIFLIAIVYPNVSDEGSSIGAWLTWLLTRVVGFIAVAYLVINGTAAPELTFVNDEA